MLLPVAFNVLFMILYFRKSRSMFYKLCVNLDNLFSNLIYYRMFDTLMYNGCM